MLEGFLGPRIGPLLSYVPAHAKLDLDYTLSDWVLADGYWNLDLLRIWLPEEVIKHIVSIPSPHSAGREDKFNWARTRSGSFFVRSAY